MAAENLLHLERRLMRVDNGERLFGRIVIGDQTACFERHGHLPLNRSSSSITNSASANAFAGSPLSSVKSNATLSPSLG